MPATTTPPPPSDDARHLAAAVVRAMERITGNARAAAFAHGRLMGVLDGLDVFGVADTIERLDAIQGRAAPEPGEEATPNTL